ncbi:SCY1 protein kinase, partial [Magnaporthiopsis poae ATCC 64411]
AVTASLTSLLQDKDDLERAGGRASRYVTEDADGTRRRREIEIDELEIQKGLLQISKALEFLHENAGLIHGNLTPDAILVNAKSDWKISGLAFCGPADGSTKPTSFQPISLHEVLNPDPRLPRSVQINLDYTSPDFVMDSNLTTSADMFSLGVLCVALYNSPHRSPIETSASISSYKRTFSSSATAPSVNNNFLSSRPLPRELAHQVLPRLITRRPAQRMTAKEFQNSEFFDNVLVSTIRFLDSFPAKTPNEKAQFMRGLNKVLPSFPKSVMEKKLLPALLEELKDRDLVSLILQNVFKIIELLPSGRRAFGDKVRTQLKDLFVTNVKNAQDKDPARDAGLMVVLENLTAITNNCGGKEFKDGKPDVTFSPVAATENMLPIIGTALESPTPSVIDAALRSLPVVLPVLDFSTIKNELFPVIATIFSRTNSLAIKVRGLQAFVILCGGSNDPAADDGLDGLNEGKKKKKTSSSSALDKYTMQEKIVPLIKVIKTKEPAVMIAALNVLRVVGQVADADFVAMELLPILWSMSLGPLLDLKQFQSFMELIRSLSKRVEEEQTKKLQELSGSTNGAVAGPNDDFMSFGGVTGTQFDATTNGGGEDDFESLVKGKPSSSAPNPMDSWGEGSGPGSNVTSPGMKPSAPAPSA